MSWRELTSTAVVVLLVVTAGCASFTASEEASTAATPSAEPTASPTDAPDGGTPTEGGMASDGTATVTETDGLAQSNLSYRIVTVETIDDTTRDVTVRLGNDGDAPATGVVVETAIYAGNTTADDDRVWTGSEEVGGVPAGDGVRFTQRVSLSLNEALAVRGADGWITIVATVRTDEGTFVVTERRNVT